MASRLSDLSALPTNNISVLTDDVFSRHFRVLQFLEELIQTVCFAALSSFPELIWHQGRQAAREHLMEDVQQFRLRWMYIYEFNPGKCPSTN